MKTKEPYTKVVREGTWIYDGNIIKMPVSILERNYDPEFTESHSEDEEYLNPEGIGFYAVFATFDPVGYNPSERRAGLSLEEALRQTEEITNHTIKWKT